jgi:hypothetical protein
MTFITATGYDVAAIMQDAHRRAKKFCADKSISYGEWFAFYLRQVWVLAQHEHRARLCTGATVTVAKVLDNGGSPLWRL